jgi:hypothetical protein
VPHPIKSRFGYNRASKYLISLHQVQIQFPGS